MPQESDAELRALQRKAYGRDAGLTDEEAARLSELDAARNERSTPAVQRIVAPEESVIRTVPNLAGRDTASFPPLVDAAGALRESSAVAMPAEGSGDQREDPRPDTSLRHALRRHWRPVASASAVLLLIGLGAGWSLFSSRSNEMPLSQEEAQRQLELYEEGKYDDGSLRAVARNEDALVWFATKSDPEELSCLVLDVGDQSSTSCVKKDEVGRFGLSASVLLPGEDGDGTSGGSSINAYGLFSVDGEPMIAIQRWDFESSMLDQFQGAERDRAEALIDEGYLEGLSILGDFRGAPVWLVDRFSDQGAVERCVIADAVEATACAPEQSAMSDGIALSAVEEDGAMWSIDVQYTNQGTPYLTITDLPTGTSSFKVDVESGDVIEILPPDTDPDR